MFITIMYQLFFDGASKGNPGIAGAGGVIYHNGDELTTYTKHISHATNNVAEYLALYIGLLRCKELNITELEVFGDSQLVIKQVTGEWKVKNKELKKVFDEIKSIEPYFTTISYKHVYRTKNKRADEMANIAVYDG